MSFYRHVKFKVTYEVRSSKNKGAIITEFSQLEPRPMDMDPIEFSSRDDAYIIGGSLGKWAKEMSQKIAEIEVKILYPGPSPYVENIKAHVDDYDEAGKIEDLYRPKKEVPKYIIELIESLMKQIEKEEKEIKRRQELVKKYKEYIKDLKEQYGIS